MSAEEGGLRTNRPQLLPPSKAEIDRESDPRRRKILAAMQQLLLGQPKHVQPGATSISDLANEAQVGRHHLYQQHSDLRSRYEYLRDRSHEPTQKEIDLQDALVRRQAEIANLKDLQSKTRQEASDWKGLAEVLARVVNVQQEELHQEQSKTQRLTRRLRQLQQQEKRESPVILLHKRKIADSELP